MSSRSLPRPLSEDEAMLLEESESMLTMGGFNPYVTPTLNSQPEIVNNIQTLPLETEIIGKAVEIYYQTMAERVSRRKKDEHIVKSFKGIKKARMIFYCVFRAYLEMGYPVDPCYAAEIVRLPMNEIDQALNEFIPPGILLIEPEKMVRFYIDRINKLSVPLNIEYNSEAVIAGTQKVLQECRSTNTGREWIQNTTAKSVAIAALYFYLNDIQGYSLDQGIIERACYLSWACIRRHHEQIAKYYNYSQEDEEELKVRWTF